MIDPTTATFSEFSEDGFLVIVGALAATQSLTLDERKLAASPVPRATLIAEAQRALLVSLWKQVYGELGSALEAIHQHARETGSLPILAITRPTRALLRPAVPVPAPDAPLNTQPSTLNPS